ncbi:MAG TPA: hypothetical protein VFM38_05600 [Candidatus Limnocylindrales bacterium]|nr:hypothetical protein [Candidatus Limnocylindrales bacterium]
MNTYLKLGALTAVVLVAVAAGVVLLPRGSNVGTPAASPAASPGPVSFTLGGDVIDLTLDASTNDSTLSGSANVSYGDFQEVPELEDQFTISIVCGRMFDASTWILAGEVDKSTHVGLRVGTRAAVFVRNSSPQEVGFWIEEPPLAADCPSFVGAIPDDAIDQPGALAPVSQGQLSLPAIPDAYPALTSTTQ